MKYRHLTQTEKEIKELAIKFMAASISADDSESLIEPKTHALFAFECVDAFYAEFDKYLDKLEEKGDNQH